MSAKKTRPYNNTPQVSGIISSGVSPGPATFLSVPLLAPFEGSRIMRWGFTRTIVGVGAGTVSVTLRENAQTVDISEPIVLDADLAVPTYQDAGGAEGGAGLIVQGGRQIDVRFTFTGSVTTATQGYVWVIWG